MGKFDFDDTNSTGIWWSTIVAIKDELIGLKDDTNCDDSEIVAVSYTHLRAHETR